MSTPAQIGQYRIVRKLGGGGMGTVYLGEHLLLGRRAAIKTLLPTLSVYPEIVDRFFNEARATSGINDHGIVQIFDFGYHVDGTAYIVMELLEGESLQDRIERLGRLAPRDALRIARQVAGSLASAHARGIIHRDLKPENVFLIRDPEASGGERTKILDFGICKLGVSGNARATQTGTTMGTPVYMSPEQCRGAGRVDCRSDLYALGCVLFHLLTGRPPFLEEGPGDYIVAHLQHTPPAPSSLVPELPSSIDALLARCLEKVPGDRFQSMAELQDAIEEVLALLRSPNPERTPLPVGTPHEVERSTKLPVRFAGPAWAEESGVSTPGPQGTGTRSLRRAILAVGLVAASVAAAVTWVRMERHGASAHASAVTLDAGALDEAVVDAAALGAGALDAPSVPLDAALHTEPVPMPVQDATPAAERAETAPAKAAPARSVKREKKPRSRPTRRSPKRERAPRPSSTPPVPTPVTSAEAAPGESPVTTPAESPVRPAESAETAQAELAPAQPERDLPIEDLLETR